MMEVTSISQKRDRFADVSALLSVLVAGLEKLKQMVAGWWYLLFPDKQIELMASERAAICGSCPHNTGTKCGVCGCPLKAKIRSPDSTCPDGRW